MADEVKPPVAIRITRPFATEDEFLEREFDTLTRTSVVLLGAQPRPQGVILRFEIVLTTGVSVLRGEGRVVAFKPIAYANEPGLVLRFTRLDSKSKELVDRAAMLRDARIRASGMPEARKSIQMPAIEVPRPPAFAQPPVFTQPVVTAPFSAPMSAASMPTSANTGAPEATIAQRPTSSRPPPLPPQAGSGGEKGRRTVPPPLPSAPSNVGASPSNRPPPQPPLPPRFAELDIESTHVESIDSSALESDRAPAREPSSPPPSFHPPPFHPGAARAHDRPLSSQPPSSEEPFKLSQPRISSLPPRPAPPQPPESVAPREPFALDPGAVLAADSSSPFVPPPIFVPPPAAPLPYVPPTPSFDLEDDVSMDTSVEISPIPPAPRSGPTYGQVFDPISVTSLDAAVPISFEEEPITNVDPEPLPLAKVPAAPISEARLNEAPPLPPMPFPPLPLAPMPRMHEGIVNGHAPPKASSRSGAGGKEAAMSPPADRDALLERLRGRARALPAERVTAILAKRV